MIEYLSSNIIVEYIRNMLREFLSILLEEIYQAR